jgi:myo-inositol-1(or 4)-monophosphatase
MLPSAIGFGTWGTGRKTPSMTAVDFGSFVEELAAKSGEVILPFFRTSLSIDNKSKLGGFDPVTAADRAAEAAMRALIRQAFPEHGIIGEEYGDERPDAEYVWVLDPIDGTKSFICGMPAWGTLIGLTRFGRPVFGTMHQPFLGESFTGDGEAARYAGPAGDRELKVRSCAALDEAVLFTTSPLLMSDQDRGAFRRVEQRVRLSRYGGDCYAYCMLAAGYIDLVIETELKPHDVVPLVPIITGAGGVLTTWDGGSALSGGRIVAAGDRRVHAAALAVLNESLSPHSGERVPSEPRERGG